MVTAIGKLVRTVGNTKSRVVQTSRQRRGGVTDLAGVDYVSEIRNSGGSTSNSTTSSTSGVISGDTSTWEARVKVVTQAVMQSIPNATANGIAGMIGCFTIESNLESKRAEGDYLSPPVGATDSSWDDDNWLNMGGPAIYGGAYPNILHRGLGLGQWTDTGDGSRRATMLRDFAKANGAKWYDLGLQIKFIFEGDYPQSIQIAKSVLTSNEDVTNTTANFLAKWEGVPGNKLGERIAKAQQALPLIQEAMKTTTETKKAEETAVAKNGDSTETQQKVSTIPDTKNLNGNTFSGYTTEMAKGDYNRGGALSSPQYVVIHHNAMVNDDGNGALAVWLKSTGKNTSAHYEVTPNKVIGVVGENYQAWHSGGSGAVTNANSIGVEHSNSTGEPDWKVADSTITNGAQLVADICTRYNIPVDREHIIGHNEVPGVSTQCPGGINMDEYVKLVKEFYDGTRTSSPANSSSNADNTTSIKESNTSSVQDIAWFIITISQDLDRFQRWYFKIIAEELTTDDNQNGTPPLTDVQIGVLARNTAEHGSSDSAEKSDGQGVVIDLTDILKKQFQCNWVGSTNANIATYPNTTPEEGFDLMKAAWDLSDEERAALFSSGQKAFFIKAIGWHKVTFRNFMKYSHIN